VSEISITYDLLFDIIRIEKSRDDLQKLDDKFYKDVADYIITKESVITNPNTPTGERELTRIQLGNIKRLLIELYDRREKKIINLAIYKIKTSSGMIITDSLLAEEKILFEKLCLELSKYRLSIIDNVITGKAPNMDLVHVSETVKSSVRVPSIVDDSEYSSSVRSVRFTRPVPRFLGPELEVYGPFEENDIASLPSKIADVLVGKARAEDINIE
jgi:DNA replication initiation complex subunit (GINS family)